MARAISVNDLLNKKRRILEFEGAWRDSLGRPELKGSWIVWGPSGSGKTRFTLQLCKYLAGFGRVAYNSLEEMDGESLARAFEQVGMQEVSKRLVLLPGESLAEQIERLKRPKSPEIIVNDSLQYLGITYSEYKELRAMFPRKLFIFISHAKGQDPATSVAQKIRYDAMIKIRVEGFKAFPSTRYGGGKPFTIWESGAADYWGLYDAQSND